jgi:hypothetical protein
MDLNHEMLYREAYNHCRWKQILCRQLQLLNQIQRNQYHGNTFEQVFKSIHNIFKRVKGLGKLSVYDVAVAICNDQGIPVTKVHIIGGGPKRAIELLNIPLQSYKIGQIKLYYVNVEPLCRIFEKENQDGDWWESYLCKWQKTV